jgi:general secretion pathway protein D
LTATSRWLVFSVTFAVLVEGAMVHANSLLPAVQVVRGVAALGQAAKESSGTLTRAEADKLLAESRKAIAAGEFDKAEALVRRAEKSNVRYTLFHRDTPKRVRRDLDRARAKAKAPTLPSSRFQVQETTADRGPGDPFMSRASKTKLAGSQPPAMPPTGLPPNAAIGLAGKAPGLAQRPFGKDIANVLPSADTGRFTLGVGVNSEDGVIGSMVIGEQKAGRHPGLPVPVAGQDVQTRKQLALQLTRSARTALSEGDVDRADRLTQQALSLGVPDSLFGPGEDRPWLVALDLRAAAGGQGRPLKATVTGLGESNPVQQSLYESPISAQDANRAQTRLVAGQPPATTRVPPGKIDRLPMPAEPRSPGATAGAKPPTSLIEQTAEERQLLTRKVAADVVSRLAESRTTLVKAPKATLERLHETRSMVAKSGVDPDARGQLLRRIDRSIQEAEKYVQDNRAQIELDHRNRGILDDIDRRRLLKIEVSQKLADMVDQFNQLRDEQRFEEMEVVAKRARELAPDEQIVQQLWREARFIRRIMNNRDQRERMENGVFQSLFYADEAAVPPSDDAPYRHPDAKVWEQLSESRKRGRQDGRAFRNERELQIEKKLESPVMLNFTNTSLSQVVEHLVRLTGVNIHLDDLGLAEEGITTDETVTIHLNNEVSLKSALNLILEPLHLSYVIKDEVLKITSEQLRDDEVYTKSYYVADLVIPIPNFVPGSHTGLQGAINDAQAALGFSARTAGFAPGASMFGNREDGSAAVNPRLLAQMPGMPGTMTGGGGMPGTGMPFGGGPGGLGGGTQADFDALIELIITTIEPDSWDENGGPGAVTEFATNLSLVVSQTQDVHEQIVDLLEQLRRLQDLQVTIEVRFITLADDFYERIGVDFDFNLVKPITTDVNVRPVSPSATVGLVGNDPPVFTADLDIPFTQNSFAATAPQFGGFDPASAANFGFAILSDIEAFFLIQAAQGDSRSNVLQAPKVTLFNGQFASVQDTVSKPFVVSVTPIVGDFAVAQQPVVVVLSEGTSLSVQAVVSPDRRYVRLTVVPFFSQIGKVDEFTFEGSSSTTKNTSSSIEDDDDSIVSETDDETEIRQGTTVQQPSFAQVTVTTTVSVPDGGTVLLGGIKRLSEGRAEVGVPLLSKIPYVDRLFRNVSIGRETQSLMMMVTPRIIIQEEEEERLLGTSSE